MLSNAYFLAKFRFDTAENEPAKNLQILLIFPILLTLTPNPVRDAQGRDAGLPPRDQWEYVDYTRMPIEPAPKFLRTPSSYGIITNLSKLY